MASAIPLASFTISDPKVDKVQIDSLVVMKIVKHVDIEFYSGMSEVAGETCQGKRVIRFQYANAFYQEF
jgi:hypothetical protein